MKLFRTLLVGAVLSVGLICATSANAAQGCGFGNHMSYWGRCVPNEPGPWARPIPGNPDCWINDRGFLRCYR